MWGLRWDMAAGISEETSGASCHQGPYATPCCPPNPGLWHVQIPSAQLGHNFKKGRQRLVFLLVVYNFEIEGKGWVNQRAPPLPAALRWRIRAELYWKRQKCRRHPDLVRIPSKLG